MYRIVIVKLWKALNEVFSWTSCFVFNYHMLYTSQWIDPQCTLHMQQNLCHLKQVALTCIGGGGEGGFCHEDLDFLEGR